MNVTFNTYKTPNYNNYNRKMTSVSFKGPGGQGASSWVSADKIPRIDRSANRTNTPADGIIKYMQSPVKERAEAQETAPFQSPQALFEEKDSYFATDAKPIISQNFAIDENVDYWFESFTKPGNAAEFATVCCFLSNGGGKVAKAVAERTTSHLECKVDLEKLGLTRYSLSEEAFAKFGGLFEYFNTTPGANYRNGIARPEYIRSESEYLELLKEKDPEAYKEERLRIEKKKNSRQKVLQEVERVKAREQMVKSGKIKPPSDVRGKVKQSLLESYPTMLDSELEPFIQTKVKEKLAKEKERAEVQAIVDERVAIARKKEEDYQRRKKQKELDLRAQYKKEYEDQKKAWAEWKQKPLSWRLNHPDEKPPRPKLKLTPYQEAEIRLHNSRYFETGSGMIPEDFT